MTIKDRTLSLLRGAPDGLTMLEIADLMPDANKYSISCILIRMAAYGLIDCAMQRSGGRAGSVPRKWNVYSLKEVVRADCATT